MRIKRKISRKDKAAIERFSKLVTRINEATEINHFETIQEKNARIKRAKKDYNFFVKTYFPHYATSECANFHIDAANRIRKDKYIKLLLGWGRGLAKSTHVDILIPLWLWINDDLKCMLLIGQTQHKANILLSDLQAEFEGNNLLKHDFGEQQTLGSWETGRFVTVNDCAFFALGMGQDPRGIRHRQYRPDYIAGDDLDSKEICRNPKRLRQYVAWICEDLIGCGDIRGCRYIQVNNVFAPETILTQIRDTRKGFQYLQINATDHNFNPTWSAKYTREYYVTLSQQVGILSFQSEYNNTPYVEGTLFTQDMVQWAVLPPLRKFERVISFWDVAYSAAKTADFNAVKIWGLKNGKFYLIKAFVRQCTMDDALRFMYAYQAEIEQRITFYYEAQFWDDAMRMTIDNVANEYDYSITLIKSKRPKDNKFDRIITLLPYYTQGKIYYNIEEKANSDMQVGISQLFGIEPQYKGHDDSPDADAYAVQILSQHVHKKNMRYTIGNKVNRKY